MAGIRRCCRLREPLDQQLTITADFTHQWQPDNGELAPVGSVPEKLLAELELAGIDEVLTSRRDDLFHEREPDSYGNLWIRPHRGKLRVFRLTDLDACYRRASQYARQSAKVKQHLAESGQGKSALLLEAKLLIPREPGSRIPLRLGAGPLSVRTDGSQVRLPLLSDFNWQQPHQLLAELAEQLLGDVLAEPEIRKAWFKRAVDRGEVVFLPDSLDQTDGDVKLRMFWQNAPLLNRLLTKRTGKRCVRYRSCCSR